MIESSHYGTSGVIGSEALINGNSSGGSGAECFRKSPIGQELTGSSMNRYTVDCNTDDSKRNLELSDTWSGVSINRCGNGS